MYSFQARKYFLLLILSLFFCIPAFYNGSALLFPDSIGYIQGGFENTPIEQRVWTYAAFIRHLSLAETLWSVVFLQALITVGSIYLVYKYLFQVKRAFYWVLCVISVAVTTAAAFHCSRVMPDFFTPLLILHAALLLWGKPMSRRDHWWCVLLLLLSLSTHNSHIVIAILLLLTVGIGSLWKPVRQLYQTAGLDWKRVGTVISTVVASLLLTSTLHWSVGGGFRPTEGGGIFLFARLCDFNIPQDYLKEHCGSQPESKVYQKLCAHPDFSLGGYFLWISLPSSIYEQGGWTEENKRIYGSAAKDMLTTPKYFFRYISRTAETTLMQFFYIDYDPLREVEGKYTGHPVQDYYPHYKVDILRSRQEMANYNRVDTGFKNSLQQVVFFLSLFILLVAFLTLDLSASTKIAILFILMGLLVNAFIMAATSGVYDRYQSRVAWLITLPAFWLLCNWAEQFFHRISPSSQNH